MNFSNIKLRIIYEGWGKSHDNYFFLERSSPVGKYDICRRKDKVSIACVMNSIEILKHTDLLQHIGQYGFQGAKE